MRRGPIRFTSGGAVLCLHSLTSPELPSSNIANLSFVQFRAIVRAVRRVARIIPLAELLDAHAQGLPTGGAIAITFDDAYASLEQAAEFIQAERVPITVFVTNDAAQTGSTFWWDRVDDLFPVAAPERWKRFIRQTGLPDSYQRGQPPEYGPLRPLRQWILAEHRGRCPAMLDSALATLEKESLVHTRHRSMTFEELGRFGAIPQVEFGVHTVTHPVLPLLSDQEFRTEVGDSLVQLQATLPKVRPILAIPFGLFDARTAALARKAGMAASLSLAGRTLAGFGAEDALPRFGLTSGERSWKLLLKTTGLAERLFSWRLAGGTGFPDLPSPTS